MRFKNLMITLTLTSLSIVAIAGLALLPITEGICDWTGDESSKNYSEEQLDDDEQGWYLNASLSATRSSASGSVSPSIHTVGVFTDEKTYSGSVNMRAWRESGFRLGWVYCTSDNGCENYRHCPGHEQMVPSESDEKYPDNTVIYATVDMATTMLVIGRQKSLLLGYHIGAKVSTTVGIDEYASKTFGGNAFYWIQNGKKYWEIDKQKRTNPALGESQGASVDLQNYMTTNCGVETSFNFEHPIAGEPDISTSNSVSYTGVLPLPWER